MISTVSIAGSQTSVCRVGFGCARLFGNSEASASARLLEAALEAGIRHFDTAPSYGDGTSEGVLGDVLRGVPDVTITTKVGISPSPRSGGAATARIAYRRFVRPLLSRAPALKSLLLRASSHKAVAQEVAPALVQRELTLDEIRASFESSLKALRRDRIDIYLVHEPDQFNLTDETAAVFEDLKRANLISAYGLAFGRAAGEENQFGSVLQSRGHMPIRPDRHRTQIFHGLLRHRMDGQAQDGFKTARVQDEVTRFLVSAPGSIFLFSASSPHQIASLMNKLRGLT